MTPEQRKTWLHERSRGMGGTDIAQIVVAESQEQDRAGCQNVSLLNVWACKSANGKPPPVAPEDMERDSKEMRRGHAMEAYIAEVYQAEHDLAVPPVTPGLVWHAKRPRILGNADRIVLHGQTRGLECKSRRKQNGWGPSGSAIVPLDVEVQCRVYMEVYGIDRWDVATAFGLDDIRFYSLVRDHDFGSKILDMAELWWERFVVGAEPPEPGWGEECRLVLERLHRDPRPTLRPPVDADSILHKQVLVARKLAKRAERNKDLLENQLRAAIGDDQGIDGMASWKAIDRRPKFELERFRTENPELYEKYCVDATPYRRLYVMGDT